MNLIMLYLLSQITVYYAALLLIEYLSKPGSRYLEARDTVPDTASEPLYRDQSEIRKAG